MRYLILLYCLPIYKHEVVSKNIFYNIFIKIHIFLTKIGYDHETCHN